MKSELEHDLTNVARFLPEPLDAATAEARSQFLIRANAVCQPQTATPRRTLWRPRRWQLLVAVVALLGAGVATARTLTERSARVVSLAPPQSGPDSQSASVIIGGGYGPTAGSSS